MSNQMKLRWAVFAVACCVGACIPFEDAREEFCRNADSAQQQEICPGSPGADGGTNPDAGTDGGTLPTGCKVASDCQAPTGQCVDSGTCVDGRCVYPVKNDAEPCSGTPSEQCRESTGTCKSGACEYTRKTSGTCIDGNACTENDTCDSSGTCIGSAMVCNAPPGQCHEPAGACSNGQCTYAFKASTASCDDGNPCTVNDKCDGAGGCAGTTLSCNSPPSQCHEWAGTCSNNACNYRLKPANSACDDGNACTTGDKCGNTGACAGTALKCDSPPSQCHEWAGTCSNNACNYRLKAAGSQCETGDQCTTDTCNASGQCLATGSVSCESTTCVSAIGCDASMGCIYDDWCTRSGGLCQGGCCRVSGSCVDLPPSP